MSFVHLDGVRRRFGARAAVDGLTLAIERGEIFGLLGPNGAGKSTTFHLLTGLIALDEGRIFIDGDPVSPLDGRVRRRFGVVFAEPALDDKLSARENLRLAARLYGLTGQKAERRVGELFELAGLTDRADELVDHYSSGMKRRLDLVRALVHEPEILILDEPSRGIDVPSTARLWQALEALRETRQTTILVTTHDAALADRCDRLAILDEGRLIACDTPTALRAQVGGDVITLEGAAPDELARELSERLCLDARVIGGVVVIETQLGAALIPRIVEALPKGRIAAVTMRRPTLADTFVHLTGRMMA